MPSARAQPRRAPAKRRSLAFYRGGLSEAEGESVREHLAACAACVGVARDARAFLAAWEAAPEKARPFGLRWLAAAAVLIVAVLAGLWAARQRPAAPAPGPCRRLTLLRRRTPGGTCRLLPRNIVAPAPEDELVFRSDGEAPSAAFMAAMLPYERGDYAAADAELARFLAAHPGHAEAGFYRGVSLLMLGRPDEAHRAPAIRGRLVSAARRGSGGTWPSPG